MTQPPLHDPYALHPTWPPPSPTAAQTVPPAAPSATGREGLPYHLVLRGGWPGAWWRSLLGILLASLAFLLMQFVALVPFVAYFALSGQDVGESLTDLADLENVTPASLAYLNVALAGLIPATWIIVRYLHGLRPRWLSSVFPRLRWKYLFACVGLAVVALVATVIVSALLPAAELGRCLGRAELLHPGGPRLHPGRAAAHPAPGGR